MGQRRTPAVFFRGGTSKAVFFKAEDLPSDARVRDAMLTEVLGGDDPYGRQLDGMGGGVSSVSKAMWVEKSARNDADVDYTFAQIAINSPLVDYSANCGNMTACVGPFAVEQGIFPVDADGDVTVRCYNTNTRKVIHARFRVKDGEAVSAGDMEIPGVPGAGAPVELVWREPSGVAGRGLLPTGNVVDGVEAPGLGAIEATIADSAALCAFVAAEDMGLTAAEAPATIDAMTDVMARLDAVRRQAAVLAGVAETPEDAPEAAPKIAIVASPGDYAALDSRTWTADAFDVAVRMESMGVIHKAIPLTGAMCVASAAKTPGSVVWKALGEGHDGSAVRIGNPSGVLTADADVAETSNGWAAKSASAYRTFRKLMEGAVLHS